MFSFLDFRHLLRVILTVFHQPSWPEGDLQCVLLRINELIENMNGLANNVQLLHNHFVYSKSEINAKIDILSGYESQINLRRSSLVSDPFPEIIVRSKHFSRSLSTGVRTLNTQANPSATVAGHLVSDHTASFSTFVNRRNIIKRTRESVLSVNRPGVDVESNSDHQVPEGMSQHTKSSMLGASSISQFKAGKIYVLKKQCLDLQTLMMYITLLMLLVKWRRLVLE